MFTLKRKPLSMPSEAEALPGRSEPLPTAKTHFVTGAALKGPYPQGFATALFGLGCFWGAERKFWEVPGVHVTAVGYAGGLTPNPTYEEVCSGRTGHNEAVFVVYDPKPGELRRAAQGVLGEPRPDPRHAAGERRRHPVPLRHLLLFRGAAPRGRGVEGGLREGARGVAASGRSRPRSCPRPSSISPRTTTSNISPRTRAAIAGSAAPASPARSAPALVGVIPERIRVLATPPVILRCERSEPRRMTNHCAILRGPLRGHLRMAATRVISVSCG